MYGVSWLIYCLYKKHSVLFSVREFQQKCLTMQRCADRHSNAVEQVRSRFGFGGPRSEMQRFLVKIEK